MLGRDLEAMPVILDGLFRNHRKRDRRQGELIRVFEMSEQIAQRLPCLLFRVLIDRQCKYSTLQHLRRLLRQLMGYKRDFTRQCESLDRSRDARPSAAGIVDPNDVVPLRQRLVGELIGQRILILPGENIRYRQLRFPLRQTLEESFDPVRMSTVVLTVADDDDGAFGADHPGHEEGSRPSHTVMVGTDVHHARGLRKVVIYGEDREPASRLFLYRVQQGRIHRATVDDQGIGSRMRYVVPRF